MPLHSFQAERGATESCRTAARSARLQMPVAGQSAAEALRKRRRKTRGVGTVSSKRSAPSTASSMARICARS